MKGRLGARLLIVVVAVLSAAVAAVGPVPAGGLQVRQHSSRPLDGLEEYERLVDNSELLLIARVLRSDSATTEFTHPDSEIESLRRQISMRNVVRRSVLEPVAWLRGGLDGDEIEVWALETPPKDPAVVMTPAPEHLPTWDRIAGVDTLGVIVRLRRSGNDWMLDRQEGAGMDAGFRVLPQRDFRSVHDSIVHARERLTIDSLVARADLIVVTAESLEVFNREQPESGLVRVVRVIKGTQAGAGVAVRPWLRFRCEPGDVLLLRRLASGSYEPIPFHRSRPISFEVHGADPGSTTTTEAAIRSALARVEAAEGSR